MCFRTGCSGERRLASLSDLHPGRLVGPQGQSVAFLFYVSLLFYVLFRKEELKMEIPDHCTEMYIECSLCIRNDDNISISIF